MSLLNEFREMLAYIDTNVNLYASADCQRSIIAGALFDVANEHAKGICILFENGCCASGFALVRVLFETYVRATWLLHCATDKELETFYTKDKIELESKKSFSFGDMIAAIEEVKSLPVTLSGIKNDAWKALNSYTHGGLFQVTRRFDGSMIQPNHDPEEVVEAIRFSSLITFLLFCGIAGVSNSSELHSSVEILYKKINQWCFV